MAEPGYYDVIGDMNQYVIALVSYVHTCKYVFYPIAANKNASKVLVNLLQTCITKAQ